MADPAVIVLFIDEAASAGIKVAFALSSLAEIVKTSSRRLQSLSDDVYATCSLLTQVKDLILSDSNAIGFNDVFERDVRSTVEKCQASFKQLERDLHNANDQIASKRTGNGRIVLTASEQMKWPFIQPRVDIVRTNLKSAKTNMHLILMTATLALAIKRTSTQQPSNLSLEEERQLKAAVLSLRRESTLIQPEVTVEQQVEEHIRLQKLKAKSNSHLRQQGRTTKRMVSFPQLRPKTSSNSGESPMRHGEPSMGHPSLYDTPSNKPAHSVIQSTPSSHFQSSRERSTSVEVQEHHPAIIGTGTQTMPIPMQRIPQETQEDASNPANRSKSGAFFPNLWRSIRPNRRKLPKDITTQTPIEPMPVRAPTSAPHVVDLPISPRLLRAWTFLATPLSATNPNGSDNFSACQVQILPVPLLPGEVSQLLNSFRETSPIQSILDELDTLNQRQRQMVLAHARSIRSRLLSVQRRAKERIETAIGEVHLDVLVWITARDESLSPPFQPPPAQMVPQVVQQYAPVQEPGIRPAWETFATSPYARQPSYGNQYTPPRQVHHSVPRQQGPVPVPDPLKAKTPGTEHTRPPPMMAYPASVTSHRPASYLAPASGKAAAGSAPYVFVSPSSPADSLIADENSVTGQPSQQRQQYQLPRGDGLVPVAIHNLTSSEGDDYVDDSEEDADSGDETVAELLNRWTTVLEEGAEKQAAAAAATTALQAAESSSIQSPRTVLPATAAVS